MAVYRIRDEDDLGVDTEFYRFAVEIIRDNDLEKYMTENGFIAKEVIFKFMDAEVRKKFNQADHIKSSSLLVRSR